MVWSELLAYVAVGAVGIGIACWPGDLYVRPALSSRPASRLSKARSGPLRIACLLVGLCAFGLLIARIL